MTAMTATTRRHRDCLHRTKSFLVEITLEPRGDVYIPVSLRSNVRSIKAHLLDLFVDLKHVHDCLVQSSRL
jgi:hypothetical protein